LMLELRRRGHGEELIRKVVYENPLTFWRQCARWQDWPGQVSTPLSARPAGASALAGRPS